MVSGSQIKSLTQNKIIADLEIIIKHYELLSDEKGDIYSDIASDLKNALKKINEVKKEKSYVNPLYLF